MTSIRRFCCIFVSYACERNGLARFHGFGQCARCVIVWRARPPALLQCQNPLQRKISRSRTIRRRLQSVCSSSFTLVEPCVKQVREVPKQRRAKTLEGMPITSACAFSYPSLAEATTLCRHAQNFPATDLVSDRILPMECAVRTKLRRGPNTDRAHDYKLGLHYPILA
jgi:hypothetical protein